MDSPQLKTIFSEALVRRVGPERAAYLDEACRGDAGLRAQVETLLSDHERIGRFLGTATGAFQPAESEDPATGDATRAETPDMCGPAGSGLGADGLGAIIGPYKLLQTLGEGGMGTVYMAEQTHPVRRKVALKVIKAGMDSRQVIARFEAERQALALMDHVNIARVLDAGATESGRPYFVMELVHGVPITKYCDDNRLTPRQRLELFVPVCQAIQHAHQKGIIHRDIKPSNVMVTLYDGKPVPKVIDFGVAKATEQKLTERTLFTQYGTLVGTLEYMSPEQAEMSALGVDTRSDVYSLGVLLYELLTGSTPLGRERVRAAAFGEILRMIKEDEPDRPSTRLSDSGEALASISAQRHTEPARLTKLVRGELDWIVMRTLEKDRTRRYETADGLAADVRRYLDDEPVQACPPSPGYRFRKFARRNKAALSTAGLLAAALLLGSIVSTIQTLRAGAAERLASRRLLSEQAATMRLGGALTRTRDAEHLAADSAKDLEWELYVSRIGQAQSEWRAANLLSAEKILDACPKPLRDWEWSYNKRLCHLGLWTDRGHDQHVWAVAFSPDGARIASASGPFAWAEVPDRGRLAVCDADTGREIYTRRLRGGVHGVAFSPDGTRLATVTGLRTPAAVEGELTVWDAATGRPLFSRVVAGANCLCVAFSPDGSRVAAGSGLFNDDEEYLRRECILWDANTGEEIRRIPGPRGGVLSVAFSPKGDRVALAGARTVNLHEVASGRRLKSFEGHASYVYDVAFSPDGTRLATAGFDSMTRVWGIETASVLLYLHTENTRGLAFSPDGSRLATASEDRTIQLWDMRTGAEVARYRGHHAEATCVAFSPDGERVLSGSRDGAVKLWGERSGSPTSFRFEPVPGAFMWVTGLSFTPDGRQVITASRDNTLRLWDAASGRQIRLWEGPKTAKRLWEEVFWCVAVRPDGRELAAGHGRGRVLRWALPGGQPLPTLQVGSGMVFSVAYSPDGSRLAAIGSQKSLVVWDPDTGRVIERSTPHADVKTGTTVKYSPDGTRIATGGGVIPWEVASGEFAVRDLRTGRNLFVRKDLPGGPRDVAFSPDGTRIAAALGDGSVVLYDATTGRQIFSVAAGVRTAYSVLFTKDGSRIITCGESSIKFWDARTGREVFTIHGVQAISAAVSPDGYRLLAGVLAPEALLWDANPTPD